MKRMIQTITKKYGAIIVALIIMSVTNLEAQDSGNALHIAGGDDYVQLPPDIFAGLNDFTI